MKWGGFNVPVKVEQMNAYLTQTLTRSIKIKSGKKMSSSRSVPEIAFQVVEDVGEKRSQRSYFQTFNIGFCHVLKRSESNLA